MDHARFRADKWEKGVPEMLFFCCPQCGEKYQIEDNFAGTEVACAKCGIHFLVPPLAQTQLPPAAASSGSPDSHADLEKEFKFENFAHDAIDGFRHLQWREIFPLKKILSWENVDGKNARFVLFLVLYPFFYIFTSQHIFGNGLPSELYFILTACSYFIWIWVFFFGQIHAVKFKMLFRGLGYMLFTATIGIVATLLLREVQIFKKLMVGLESGEKFLGYVLAVGPTEEFAKMLPLLIFGIWRKGIFDRRTGIFYGLMSGFGFALTEYIEYLGETRNGLEMMGQVLIRSLSLSFLHGAWCGIIGFNIGLTMKYKITPKWPTIIVPYLLCALLHGLYDYFCGGIFGVLFVVITTMLLMTYMAKAKEDIPQEVR